MAGYTDPPAKDAKFFKETWPEFQRDDIDVMVTDTDMVRMGWPKPTIYREHEIIHILLNIIDHLREEVRRDRTDDGD